MKAVVYTSQTGFTAWYARLLAEKAGLPAIPLERAARELGRLRRRQPGRGHGAAFWHNALKDRTPDDQPMAARPAFLLG